MTLLHISLLNGNKFVHISVKSKLSHHNLITNTQKQGSLKPTDFFLSRLQRESVIDKETLQMLDIMLTNYDLFVA